MKLHLMSFRILPLLAAMGLVAACERGGEGQNAATITAWNTHTTPIEPERLTARLNEQGLPEVLIDGVKAVRASWVFWGKEWQYANADMRPAEKNDRVDSTSLAGTINDLGLTVDGTISRSENTLTLALEFTASRDLPAVIGGGIEFGIDLSSFPGVGPPEILPENRGWQWPTDEGSQIRFVSDSPLAKIYFERGDRGRIRCFFFDGAVSAGTHSFTLRLTLPQGAKTTKPYAQRFAQPDATWLADPLLWNAWPIDVGTNNEKPAGQRGRVENQGGRLVFADGSPARFWGINLQAYALFSGSDAQIQRQADRIAAMGFNLVRIHHADSGWVQPNLFGADGLGGDFNEPMARRIDRWIAALKARGVYVWLDLHVGRRMDATELTVPEGREEVRRNGGSIKGFNYVNPKIQAAMDSFVRTYLERTNHITGIRYAEDPAIMAVLLTNENDLTTHFANLMLADKNNPVHHGLLRAQLAPIAKGMGISTAQAMRTWEPGPSKLALAELERRFFDRQIEVVRSTGYTGLIATTNHWAGMGLSGLASLTRGDLIDVHSYGEPGELSRDPRSGATWLARIAQARVIGIPTTISEWNIPNHERDRFTTPLHMSAMASFQGWDAPMLYGYLQEPLSPPKKAREWSAWVDPSLMAIMPAASVMFRDGHVAEAKQTLILAPTREQVYLSDLTADSAPALRAIFETHALAVQLPDTPELDFDTPTQPNARITNNRRTISDLDYSAIKDGAHSVTSDTGEIRRDWQRGVVEIRTPKSQAAMGWIGHNQESGGIDLGDVTLRIKTSAATVAVTSLDNKPIRESGRLLVTAVAQAVSGAEGNQSNAVWIAEPVVGTVEIDVGGLGMEEGKYLTLRAIDSTGRAVNTVQLEPDEHSVISIPLDGSGLWWIVETD